MAHNIVEALIWAVALFVLFWTVATLIVVIAVKRQIKKVKAALGEAAGGDITESLFSLFSAGAGNQRFQTMGKTVKVKYDPVEGSVMEETVTDASGNTKRRFYKQNPQTGNWEETTSHSNQAAFAAIDSGESDDALTIDAEVVEPDSTPAAAQQPDTPFQLPFNPEAGPPAEGTKFCPHCYAVMQVDDNFCISCGHTVGI